VYRGGSLETLGTLGGAESEARGINNQNAVVGWALTATGARHAFLYQANDLTDLNDHLPEGSGWELQQANGINTAGQIVGFGRFQGATHAFLLSPTDPQLAIATYAGITVSGETGARYRLEHAPHAAGDPWTQWLQIELTNRTQTFIDFDSPQHPRRIYRAVRLDP
jgi:probable HAF family extracellular repeat protein